MLSAIKTVHVAAVGALLVSVVGQMSGWTSWDQALTPPGMAGLLGAIGGTLVAMFSDKPRDPNAQTRSGD